MGAADDVKHGPAQIVSIVHSIAAKDYLTRPLGDTSIRERCP
jgi:hypothetical protein